MAQEASTRDWIIWTAATAVFVFLGTLAGAYSSLSKAPVPVVISASSPDEGTPLPQRMAAEKEDVYRMLRSVPTTSGAAAATLGYSSDDVDTGYSGDGHSYPSRRKTVHVRSYIRRDGTYVRSYFRRPPRNR